MVFKPPIRPIRHYVNIGFDIETYGESNDFLFCSLYFPDDKYKLFMSKEEFLGYLIENSVYFDKKRIFAHNMQFDFLGAFGDDIKNFRIIQRGSDFISAKSYIYDNVFNISSKKKNHHQNSIGFFDTKNFYNSSLEEAGKIIGMPKMKTPEFIGYKPKTKEEWEYFKKYNVNDSKVCKYFSDYLQTAFNSLGGEMKSTIAASSMDLYKRKYLNRVMFTPKISDIEYMYNCYYGGRTEIFNRGYCQEKLNCYDFNSLYPSVMRDNIFPIQNNLKKTKILTKNIINDYEGFCYAELEFNEDIKIPFLCARHDNKLVFPKGKIKGHYTFFEIRKAKEYGYKIISLKNAFYYKKSENIFKDFVDDLYKKRMEFKEQKNPMETAVKILMNSLYGKFGQKIETDEVIHANGLTKKEFLTATPINDSEYFRVKRKMRQCNITYINPIIASYVTAYARFKLFSSIHDKEKNVYYVDTDSIFTPDILNNSKNLGELKLEYKTKEGYFVKPKFYAVVLDDGKEKTKIKGVSSIQNYDAFKEILHKCKANARKFTKFRESLTRNIPFNSKLEFEKILNLEDNKRDWLGKKFSINDFQDSRPLTVC